MRYAEFFAGGGMARAGLGPDTVCALANDIDPKKGAAYAANWGDAHLVVRDVGDLRAADMPGSLDLAWASSPCQDVSLAGVGSGLRGARSGAFWPWWDLMRTLARECREPRVVAFENVTGLLTSHGGADFRALAAAFAEVGYRLGAMVVDAAHFVPQSRPRLFVVAVHDDVAVPADLIRGEPDPAWHGRGVLQAHAALDASLADRWLWWRLPPPPRRDAVLADLIEDEPTGVAWRSAEETDRLLDLMSPVNLAKLEREKAAGGRRVGTLYRRTRPDGKGGKALRAEVRFDGTAGCLRTPAGGSSVQTLVVVEGDRVRTRRLSPREAARLMGLPDGYRLPTNYVEAYHLLGDGVVVPVVRFLAEHLLAPLTDVSGAARRAA